MSRPDVSESTLRSDTWINCLRELMSDHVTHGKNAGKIKVPKIESYHLRDEIIETMNENKGNVTVKQFVDLVAKYFGKFLKKKGWTKGKMISGAAKAGGVDPTNKKGRKWWVDGCGGNESDFFIQNYGPSFYPGGGWIDKSSGENLKPDETAYFNDLLMCIGREAASHMPEGGVLSNVTNVERASLRKKRRKKKRTGKKKPSKKRHSPKKKKRRKLTKNQRGGTSISKI